MLQDTCTIVHDFLPDLLYTRWPCQLSLLAKVDSTSFRVRVCCLPYSTSLPTFHVATPMASLTLRFRSSSLVCSDPDLGGRAWITCGLCSVDCSWWSYWCAQCKVATMLFLCESMQVPELRLILPIFAPGTCKGRYARSTCRPALPARCPRLTVPQQAVFRLPASALCVLMDLCSKIHNDPPCKPLHLVHAMNKLSDSPCTSSSLCFVNFRGQTFFIRVLDLSA
ncbi:hypothetical protein MTO96_025827 [Rhipicephalus appendiculatus]